MKRILPVIFISLFIFFLQQAKASDTATITINLFSADDSTRIDSTVAVLYNGSGNKIDSVQVSGNQVVFSGLSTTSVHRTDGNIPEGYQLLQNYPNPFNPTTRIAFQIPKAGPVSLEVYNILGQEEVSLEMRLGAGMHEVEYTPGGAVGIRFYRIKTDNFSQTKKMVDLGGSGGKASLRLINSNGEGPVNSIHAPNDVIQAIAKTAGANYSVRILNLPSTTPQIVDTVIQITNLVNNITNNIYISRKYLNFDEIKNKLESAHDGDTIYIPAGTCIITSKSTVNNNITIIGAGIDKTILKTDSINRDVLKMNVNSSSPVRISNMTFKGCGAGTNDLGVFITLVGNNENIRVDHCKFTLGGVNSFYLYGVLYGVIDHCIFLNDSYYSIRVYSPNLDVSGDLGSYVWNLGHPLGTQYALFIEDCTFIWDNGIKGGAAIGTGLGSRYVFRHNTLNSVINQSLIDCHGPGGYNKWWPGTRGSYSVEVYNNYLNATVTYYGMYFRGGRGVVFNNTYVGYFGLPICLADYCSFNENNVSDKTSDTICKAYPTPDQINNFYIWNNTAHIFYQQYEYYNGMISDGYPALYVLDRGLERDHIQKNLDYFDAEMPGYTPYTYPHPLAK